MTNPARPDLGSGVLIRDIPDGGLILGQVGDEDVILVRRGDELFALGALCTHYHGPLAEGLVVGDTVRCPWHHACFSLRTGEAVRAPALDPIARWRVERIGETAFVRDKLAEPIAKPSLGPRARKAPASVVIVGGGGAGLAAADMLRREGYDGTLSLISADDSPPYDRPNLSKDFLAGTAPADWIPLRTPEYYADRRINLVLGARVSAVDLEQRQVQLENGQAHGFEALLIATGAEPVRLPIEGAAESQVHYLRSFADSRALVAKAASARRVVVVGASFIGLEVAASLRKRGIEVSVVAPEKQPLERILGPEVGLFVRGLHEAQGVGFHLGQTVGRVEGRVVTLSGGAALDADFVVAGVGVRPSLALAERAGLTLDRGIAVDEFLETSAPGVFAAGDVARWPDPHSGERIRVEHWVVAQRQGQTAAKNMLGQQEPFTAVPFFWSQHYDTQISYVGHAEKWDAVEVDGKLDAGECAVAYKLKNRTLAVATISRDRQSLEVEAGMDSGLPRRPSGR
jgi:NADPH-dependent 2,4-dienoyl-CoA reductase/sulfur reductase-like enzyme/nitrite reductase/ring-hydroxylating ferredoxin subunit